jgi:hypothetical protein
MGRCLEGEETMSQQGTVTLQEAVSLARQLPALDKVRLIEWLAPEIERDLLRQQPQELKSLLGLCADLGPAPSAGEIDEIRHEMWVTFPREDVW